MSAERSEVTVKPSQLIKQDRVRVDSLCRGTFFVCDDGTLRYMFSDTQYAILGGVQGYLEPFTVGFPLDPQRLVDVVDVQISWTFKMGA